MKNQNLYLVKLVGSMGVYTSCYVIATDPTSAYNALKNLLDKRNYGFSQHRSLHSIELIAEQTAYTATGHFLLIPQEAPDENK